MSAPGLSCLLSCLTRPEQDLLGIHSLASPAWVIRPVPDTSIRSNVRTETLTVAASSDCGMRDQKLYRRMREVGLWLLMDDARSARARSSETKSRET
ncbi:hypothetical protein ElyMa_003374100 [Elysia marginata]|uniref:Uncharacterized protein n=1 Tax=Elysia marginata TaxID=1093978 RepID=A0AAV4JJ79_9GAST|nr:hypothetical protein ElyMa_003374100 [Elysia marginata]